MQEQRKPEIEEADLTPMVLDIAAFGESDPMSLPWLTSPSNSNIFNAKHLLLSLQAINEDGSVTLLGRKMASLPSPHSQDDAQLQDRCTESLGMRHGSRTGGERPNERT